MNAPLSPDKRSYWDGTAWRPIPQDVEKFWDGTEWRPVPQPVVPQPGSTSTPEHRRAWQAQQARARSNWWMPAIVFGVIGGLMVGAGLLSKTNGLTLAALIPLALCAVFAIMDNRARRKHP